MTVHQLSRKQLFEAFCKDDVQDSRKNRIKTEVVTMLGLFWRCIPVFSMTLKSKYIASANFMLVGKPAFQCLVGQQQNPPGFWKANPISS